MNKIKKQSKFLYKKLKGKLEVLNVVDFLGTLGYDVIFFNETDRADLSRQYGIKLNDTKAITYFGDTRIVFVKDELSGADKLHLLFHECGHILLGHVEENQIHSIDSIQSENEAEVFAYEIMHYSKNKWKKPALFLSIILLLSLHISIFPNSTPINNAIETSFKNDYTTSNSNALVDVPQKAAVSQYDEIVYITRTGECYHKASCRYGENYGSSKISKKEAQKTHRPCSICKP